MSQKSYTRTSISLFWYIINKEIIEQMWFAKSFNPGQIFNVCGIVSLFLHSNSAPTFVLLLIGFDV